MRKHASIVLSGLLVLAELSACGGGSDTPDPLAASASASVSAGQAPLEVTFAAQVTGGEAPFAYAWAFGDGGTGAGESPTHTYQAAGTFQAVLTVTDAAGAQATSSLVVNVTADSQPAVAILADPVQGVAPLAVSFTSQVTGGEAPFAYAWAFGDGGTSDLQAPGHTFESPGVHTVTLTVTDRDGDQATATALIDVRAAAAPCRRLERLDADCDEQFESCRMTELDAAGRAILEGTDPGCDGLPPFSQCVRRTFDAQGRLTAQGQVGDCGPVPDSGCVSYTYDAFGRKLTERLDEECLGAPSECLEFTYDAAGNRVNTRVDVGCDYQSVYCLRATYDSKGALLSSWRDAGCDQAPAGDADCRTYTYYANGKLRRIQLDHDCDGTPDLCHQVDYFQISGRGTYVVTEQSDCSGGDRLCVLEIYKGGHQVMTERQVDQDCDGTPDAHCQTMSYDSRGNKVREALDADCDGTPERCSLWRYSDLGQLLATAEDAGCDGQANTACTSVTFEGDCAEALSPQLEADVELACGSPVLGDTARDGEARLSQYSCLGWTPTGPEVIHRFIAPREGCDTRWEISATLSGLSADLDLLLLTALDPTKCAARSVAAGTADESLTFEAAPGSVHHLVVEGYGEAASAYALALTCTCKIEPSPTCVDRCGGLGGDGLCSCDEACGALGDCCPDMCAACPTACPEPPTCEGLPPRGCCEGSSLRRCAEGAPEEIACGAEGCGWGVAGFAMGRTCIFGVCYPMSIPTYGYTCGGSGADPTGGDPLACP
jgi:PKD repeat protein